MKRISESDVMQFARRGMLMAVCAPLVQLFASPLDGSALLKSLSAKYSGAQNVVVRFTEGEGQAKIRGIATVAGPSKFRVELSDRSIICNGATVWNYTLAEKRVTIDAYRPNRRTLSPEFFITKLPANAKVTMSDAKDPQHTVLQLEPTTADEWGVIKKLMVETDRSASSIYSVTIIDESNSSRTIHVQSTTFDKKLPPDIFEFNPPAGASIMDLR